MSIKQYGTKQDGGTTLAFSNAQVDKMSAQMLQVLCEREERFGTETTLLVAFGGLFAGASFLLQHVSIEGVVAMIDDLRRSAVVHAAEDESAGQTLQ